EALFDELFRWPEVGAVIVGAVRGYRVGSPVQHHGILLGRTFRRVHGSEQAHAVAHRDQEFRLGVVGLDVVAMLPGRPLLGGGWRNSLAPEEVYRRQKGKAESDVRHYL